MEEFGCHLGSRTAFGAQGAYPYSAELISTGEPVEIEFRFALDGNPKPAADVLRAEKQPHLRWYTEPADDTTGGILGAIVTPPSDFYARGAIHTLLHAAEEQLAAAGLAPPENCPLCGLPACDTCAWLAPDYRPTHASCLQTRLDLPDTDEIPPKRPYGNIATGILGALLGAAIAALPIWSLALSRDRIYFALYAFIPILSGLMYRTLRGRANKNLAGLSVLGASLLAAMALELVWYWMVLSASYGVNIPFWGSVATYFDTHTLFTSLREMLSCLAALLVGYVAVTVFLRRYENEKQASSTVIRGAVYVRASAAPYPPGTRPKPETLSEGEPDHEP